MNTRYHLKLENEQVLTFEVLDKKGIEDLKSKMGH